MGPRDRELGLAGAQEKAYAEKAYADQIAMATAGPSRLRADVALIEQAERLERRARGLRVLAGLIPRDGLTGEAEAAIWEVATACLR